MTTLLASAGIDTPSRATGPNQGATRRLRGAPTRITLPWPDDVPAIRQWLRRHARSRAAAVQAWRGLGGGSTTTVPLALIRQGARRFVIVAIGRRLAPGAIHPSIPAVVPSRYVTVLVRRDPIGAAILGEARRQGIEVVWWRVPLIPGDTDEAWMARMAERQGGWAVPVSPSPSDGV